MNGNAGPTRAWESFWRAAPTERGAVLWDAGPKDVAAGQLPLFAPHQAEPLPLIDIGCGNGTQTAFLAERHPGPVVGVDLSAEAVGRAAALHGGDFRRLDVADAHAVRALHDELGDCHLYQRGVLHHQAGPEARAAVVKGLAVLLGARGRGFVVEPAAAAKAVLGELMGRPGGPPPRLAAVFEHGITPGEMSDASLPALFTAGGLSVLASGTLPLALTLRDPDGSRVTLPSNWLVVGASG